MTLIFFICLGTLLVVLQTTLFMPSPAWAYAPDFFYVFIAYLASRFDVFRGILLVYLVGLMLDVLVGSVLGMYSLLCFLGYGLIRIVEQNLKRGSLLYSIPLISCSFLLLSSVSSRALLIVCSASFRSVMSSMPPTTPATLPCASL